MKKNSLKAHGTGDIDEVKELTRGKRTEQPFHLKESCVLRCELRTKGTDDLCDDPMVSGRTLSDIPCGPKPRAEAAGQLFET
eukprot:1001294-Prorocentrum_minimum.AAC.1